MKSDGSAGKLWTMYRQPPSTQQTTSRLGIVGQHDSRSYTAMSLHKSKVRFTTFYQFHSTWHRHCERHSNSQSAIVYEANLARQCGKLFYHQADTLCGYNVVSSHVPALHFPIFLQFVLTVAGRDYQTAESPGRSMRNVLSIEPLTGTYIIDEMSASVSRYTSATAR